MIKIILRRLIGSFGELISRIFILFSNTRAGIIINNKIIHGFMNYEKSIIHNNHKLRFVVPNHINHFRINTFSNKEPETLDWIDSFKTGSIFWDIGANVGLYSIYASIHKQCKIVCFEPSVFNLELLARNIYLNNQQELISIFPIPISDKNEFNLMKHATMEWGGALSTFGKDFAWDGKKIDSLFSYKTFSFSLDSLIEKLNLPMPNHIKIDVDGIEHIILSGGKKVLKNINSILIEINDDFEIQKNNCERLLRESGLKLHGKLQSEMVNNSSDFANTFNQIWIR